jgi:hypothetical protein
MRKLMIAAAAATALFAGNALADEPMMTTTPELALPEPEAQVTTLPHSSVTETAPLALPEAETEAAAPYKGCSDRETVYLTN